GVVSRKGYMGVKAALDLLGREFHIEPTVKPRKSAALHPARAGQVWLGSKLLGEIGEVHPDLTRRYKIPGQLGYLEISFDELVAASGDVKYQNISRFPSVHRDLSLELKDSIAWEKVKEVIEETGLGRPRFLSDYHGKDLPAGAKGLAVRIEFSSTERTLTDVEADQQLSQVLKALERKLGAKLRS
ncbi:MAG TPA: hypothetical protein VLF41_03845, partial [Candidatus Nanoarchaeia archaeon]|nr:hypothetical protein [Candidatus Nanoarchaeia archaeon]